MATFRATALFPPVDLRVESRVDGSLVLSVPPVASGTPDTLAGRLAVQAKALGDKTLIAARDDTGEWAQHSYASVHETAGRIAGWFASRPGEDRVLIVTGNSVPHALLTFGAAAAGVPICPVSAQYAQSPTGEYGRLRNVIDIVKPTVVFAEVVAPIADAMRAVLPGSITLICTDPAAWPGAVDWSDVVGHPAPPDIADRIAALDPRTPLRYMATSGSTGLPKIVVQTNLMWCSLFDGASHVLGEASGWRVRTMDWMPWSHVAGASVLIGTMLNGGSFYLDEGRPTPELFGATLRNIAEVQPLFFANVPYAFGMLCDAIEQDPVLRERFFEHLQLCLYGGAGLPQPVYDRFQRLAEQTIGERVMFTTGYGCTEATAGIMTISWPTTEVGVGLPVPGLEVKLVPLDEERYEARFRGDCVMPGYLDNPTANAECFDSEGFYRSGDALAFHDRARPERGMVFAGRLAEEFKLITGSFVQGGQVRADLLARTSPVVLDALICGEGHDEIGVLLWLNPSGCVVALGQDATEAQILDWLRERVPAGHSATTRIARFAVLTEPPNVDAGELSDKGSINQSIALRRRRVDVERLYANGPGVQVLPR
ncbi:AMP-binding protein [Actinocrispum sp. NPDC049592]|uniref:AMP-binding protein n=1 Tax=Actinocrispum sp. NPDC049592 TaxID=3154835 RepID=UPI00344ACDBD